MITSRPPTEFNSNCLVTDLQWAALAWHKCFDTAKWRKAYSL